MVGACHWWCPKLQWPRQPNCCQSQGPNHCLPVSPNTCQCVSWISSNTPAANSAKVRNAATTSTTGLQWFKIAEDGFSSSSWAVDRMISGGGWNYFTLPSCIAPGNYLMRVELIALHAAFSSGGAQFYVSCNRHPLIFRMHMSNNLLDGMRPNQRYRLWYQQWHQLRQLPWCIQA